MKKQYSIPLCETIALKQNIEMLAGSGYTGPAGAPMQVMKDEEEEE